MTPVEFLNARWIDLTATARAVQAQAVTDGIDPEGSGLPQLALAAHVLADIAAKRAILEWHQNWPVLAEKQPTFDQPAMATDFSSATASVTVRLSRQIAWLTEQEYRNRFGSEPPTGPIIRLMLQPFTEHPDFDRAWSV